MAAEGIAYVVVVVVGLVVVVVVDLMRIETEARMLEVSGVMFGMRLGLVVGDVDADVTL